MENNERPYIEVDGKIYEFEATFNIKREYDRDTKKMYMSAIEETGLTENELEELTQLQKYIEENPEMEVRNLSADKKEQLKRLFKISSNLDLMPLYEKYCFKMLENKYKINKDEFYEILDGFANKYGMEYVDVLLQKVCEKVFTQTVEKNQKNTLPSWMN